MFEYMAVCVSSYRSNQNIDVEIRKENDELIVHRRRIGMNQEAVVPKETAEKFLKEISKFNFYEWEDEYVPDRIDKENYEWSVSYKDSDAPEKRSVGTDSFPEEWDKVISVIRMV